MRILLFFNIFLFHFHLVFSQMPNEKNYISKTTLIKDILKHILDGHYSEHKSIAVFVDLEYKHINFSFNSLPNIDSYESLDSVTVNELENFILLNDSMQLFFITNYFPTQELINQSDMYIMIEERGIVLSQSIFVHEPIPYGWGYYDYSKLSVLFNKDSSYKIHIPITIYVENQFVTYLYGYDIKYNKIFNVILLGK